MQKRAIKNASTANGSVLYQHTVRKTDSAQWAELGMPQINRGSSKHYSRQERCSQQLYSSRVRTKEEKQKFDALYCNSQEGHNWFQMTYHSGGEIPPQVWMSLLLSQKAQNIHKDHPTIFGGIRFKKHKF